MLIRKGVKRTVTHLFLSKIEVSKIEVKEGGEQTSVSDSDSFLAIGKWVTDLNGLSQGRRNLSYRTETPPKSWNMISCYIY